VAVDGAMVHVTTIVSDCCAILLRDWNGGKRADMSG